MVRSIPYKAEQGQRNPWHYPHTLGGMAIGLLAPQIQVFLQKESHHILEKNGNWFIGTLDTGSRRRWCGAVAPIITEDGFWAFWDNNQQKFNPMNFQQLEMMDIRPITTAIWWSVALIIETRK